VQHALDGQHARYSDQAGEEWAGVTVAKVLGLNPVADRRRIKKMIEAWLASGALVKGEVLDGKRTKRPSVEVGEWATV